MGEELCSVWGVVCLEQLFDGRLNEFGADEEFVRVAPRTAPTARAEDGLRAVVPMLEHGIASQEDTLTARRQYCPADEIEQLAVFDDAVIFSAHVLGVERTAFGLVSGDATAGQFEIVSAFASCSQASMFWKAGSSCRSAWTSHASHGFEATGVGVLGLSGLSCDGGGC